MEEDHSIPEAEWEQLAECPNCGRPTGEHETYAVTKRWAMLTLGLNEDTHDAECVVFIERDGPPADPRRAAAYEVALRALREREF